MKLRSAIFFTVCLAVAFGCIFAVLTSCAPEQASEHEHGDTHSEAHDQRAKGADSYVARALPASEQQGFDSACKNAWREASDRIVFPNQAPPVGHLHRGFGTDVNHDSTLAAMHTSDTNCNRPEDTAGYWIPALETPDGREVRPIGFKAYYRTDVPADQLNVPPENLKLIAGDKGATSPQNKQITSWNCKSTTSSEVTGPYTEPTNCPSRDYKPRAKVTFPQCLAVRKSDPAWPLVDSEDHRSHAAYPTKTDAGYRCPDSHPYPIVRVGYQISYPGSADTGAADMSRVTFASGGRYSMHADFWQTFRMTGENGLKALTERCFASVGTFCSTGNQPR